MIICAGNNETFDFAIPMGVGLIETTMNLTRACLFDKPEFLLFIGSAGSYGELKFFDIIESKTASNIELAFLNNDAYTPLDNVISTNMDKTKKDVIVNSSNYISTNEELTKKFLNFGVGIENMEFFAVLKVAQEFNIPAGGVFCITNYTNKNAHEDFLENHEKAKKILALHVKKRIKELTLK
ncbi:MAG: purine-nucleoside phosphorylase [Sulfurimonas sp. RIFOXYD12_FULL_33_39]|uniref:phosphorylase family protein n=1 Tax=unclassified Sulfurimonas TaxID=2623549 RepID=UPI0008CF7551|nr:MULTISPECIES: purine-nucleoside phosphorylase [unclassified Sulfurimonas]OHE04883.1 MAG: purine-nucleoside phosphorylase [Sulfurimonas sp. RIFCSPLOWO2_12_FULL_34_6]OHE10949.1 MAG: purine-nucleoside phosphorylase [Sulfurimonas sp. RIFOXYD12_FULL_33_39]OHE13282.1 MAG: purine-nucleoside phosphorylase [Sulfurimonas sp. RIFOXYD2_FULL_34_21]DAB27883.1 MAG TPA: purine-nucleoside phosphorylase [Sulfurimonas sp. UBA10385]